MVSPVQWRCGQEIRRIFAAECVSFLVVRLAISLQPVGHAHLADAYGLEIHVRLHRQRSLLSVGPHADRK